MSTSQTSLNRSEHITPPSSLAVSPLTPPPTDEKPFAQAHRVIALFKDRQAGKHHKQRPWTEYQLALGEYDEILRQLSRDELLLGYVKDKIRHDYCQDSLRLVVRMPTSVHEVFIDGVEDAIRSQLKQIRCGSDRAALFAQKVRPTRSSEIRFVHDDTTHSFKSKYEPDTSFWHDDAQFPGVIIEVAYSQKRKRLDRLAEAYLLDSDASVQVVVGLDIEYGKPMSRMATMSVWRTRVVHTADGDELRVVEETTDEAFRDNQGHPTDHQGLRLRLRDFSYEELTQNAIGDEDRELVVSTQLCQYLATAESRTRQHESLGRHSIHPGVKKRKRPETPPDQITTDDEAIYFQQEERAAKRIAASDLDYEGV